MRVDSLLAARPSTPPMPVQELESWCSFSCHQCLPALWQAFPRIFFFLRSSWAGCGDRVSQISRECDHNRLPACFPRVRVASWAGKFEPTESPETAKIIAPRGRVQTQKLDE